MSTNFPISVCCNSRCSCESLKRCLTEEKVWPNCHKHPRSCITLAEKSCFEEPEPFASLHLVVIRLEAYLSHPHREGGMRSRECVPPISPRYPGNLQIGRACEIFADSLQNLWFCLQTLWFPGARGFVRITSALSTTCRAGFATRTRRAVVDFFAFLHCKAKLHILHFQVSIRSY